MKLIIRSIALIALAVSPFSHSISAQVLSRDAAASAHVRSNYADQATDLVGKNKVETAQLGQSNNAPLVQLGLTTNAHPALVGGVSPSRTFDGMAFHRFVLVIIRGIPRIP
jgi:hypothetical protein